MGNSFITPDVVAKQGIIALLNNWVFAGLVYRDYSKEFKKVGNTVRIAKPNTFTTVEFDGDLAGQWQNVTEEETDVVMDTILTVPIEITQLDLTLSVRNFYTQVVEPAMQSIADAVDVKIAKLYKDIPFRQAASSTTAISDITSLRKIMSDNKVPPRDRRGVLSPLTFASLLNLDTFRDLEKTGETSVLREASMGRRFGFDLFESQNVQHHTQGTTDEAGALSADAALAATSLALNLLGTGTINKGTIVIITGDTQPYVVTADAAISGAAATVSIYPALKQAALSAAVVTMQSDDANTVSRENIFFHKNCFAMVSSPIEPPIGGALGATENYNGLTLNVVYSYGHDQFKNKMTISLLCGFKTLTPELGVRLHDAS